MKKTVDHTMTEWHEKVKQIRDTLYPDIPMDQYKRSVWWQCYTIEAKPKKPIQLSLFED